MKMGIAAKTLVVGFIFSSATVPAANAEENTGNEGINSCISTYRDGYYQFAVDCLNSLLPTLQNCNDSIMAFKYLGLSYGMLNYIDRAKLSFRNALEKNPALEIDTLEFPPNIALIYKQVKLEKVLEKIDTSHAHPSSMRIGPLSMVVMSIATGGAGAYLYFHSEHLYKDYTSISQEDQGSLDRAFNRYKNAALQGYVCDGLFAVLLPVSLYLFHRQNKHSGKTHISLVNGCPALAVDF